MSPIFPSKPKLLTVLAGIFLMSASGCQQDVVHQRSMAELNQKAQAMMQAGDYNGAVARLEAARDLQPNEPNTTYNLAVAYQMQGNYDKAIETFKIVVDQPGMQKAEILKALGITYEAKADKLSADAAELEADPKADKAKLQQAQQEAITSYQAALDYYQQALGAGLKNAAEVEKQVEAIQAKLTKPQGAMNP